jgi:hypothetical protein
MSIPIDIYNDNMNGNHNEMNNAGVGNYRQVSSSSSSSSTSSAVDSFADVNPQFTKRKRKSVDPAKKKPRVDYKNPHHAERLQLAIVAVIESLGGQPDAFHKNIMVIAKLHNIPYNTLRDNFLRARGIEPRAHRYE